MLPATTAEAVLKEIRMKLGRAQRLAMGSAFAGLLGEYLQVLAYIWGTAVLLSGLVNAIDDWDFWVVAGLVGVGSVVLLAVRAGNQVHQGWMAGYYRDGFRGYVLPLFKSNRNAPEDEGHAWVECMYVTGTYLPFGLVLAGIALSAWRLTILGMVSSRTVASLLMFYFAISLSCLLFLLSHTLRVSGAHGDPSFCGCFWRAGQDDFESNCSFTTDLLQIHYPGPAPAAPGERYGLKRKQTRYHFEHMHAAAVTGGMWQGLTHATPIAYLLQEYYFSRNKELNLIHAPDTQNLFYLIHLFYEHGTPLEKCMVRRWQSGVYSSDVMLVPSGFRPGRKLSGSESQKLDDCFGDSPAAAAAAGQATVGGVAVACAAAGGQCGPVAAAGSAAATSQAGGAAATSPAGGAAATSAAAGGAAATPAAAGAAADMSPAAGAAAATSTAAGAAAATSAAAEAAATTSPVGGSAAATSPTAGSAAVP
jgi:hypothetical protein